MICYKCLPIMFTPEGFDMATITAKKNNQGKVISYKVTVCVGRDEQYKQVWRTCTIKRPEGLTPGKEKEKVKKLADAWADAQKAEYKRTNAKVSKEKITLEQFIKDHWWKDHVNDEKEHKPTTISFYRYMSDDIIDYFGSKKKLVQIDTEDVKRYIKYLNNDARTKSGEPYSAATVRHHFGALRNILQYARRMHYIPYDPCQDLSQKEKPHKQNKAIDFLSPQEARRFLDCLSDEPLFWRCCLNVLIKTGLRRGECLALQWGDINSDDLTMNICRNVTVDKKSQDKVHIGSTKTGDSRTLAITEKIYGMLMELKKEQESRYGTLLPSAFVFCSNGNPYKPIYPTELTRWQQQFVERNGLPNVSPHDLRHTAATLAIEAGATLKQVQEMLGHKHPSTTMAFYAGVTEEGKRRTVEGIESLIG